LQLLVNGQQKSVATATVDAESKAEVSITYTNTEPGFKKCILGLDDQSITKDDKFFFSYKVAEKINLYEIKGMASEVDAVAAVFSDDPYFNFTTSSEGNIDFGAFSTQNFIILNQLQHISSGLSAELEKFASAGGSVLIIPASEIVLNEYNDLMGKFALGQILGKMGSASVQDGSNSASSNKVSNVNYDHYIFKNAFEKSIGNVDLPGVRSWYEINMPSKTTAEPMMSLQSGSPFMISNVFGSGRVYCTAVSLSKSESDFISHAFFPASLLRMAEFSQPSSQLSYVLGNEQAIVIRNLNMGVEETFHLKDSETGSEFIPEHRNAGGNTEIYVHSEMNNAGNFDLYQGQTQVDELSFNYNRLESDSRSLSVDEAKEQISSNGWSNWSVLSGDVESIAASADEIKDGKKYWFTMIVWALILLAIEILLIKFWR